MFGRRPQPEIIIESLWQGVRFARLDVPRRRSLPQVDPRDLSEFPGLHQLNDAPVIAGRVVNVISHLAHSGVIQRCVSDRAALRDTVAERLLDEYVLTRLKGAHRGYRVPVVWTDD